MRNASRKLFGSGWLFGMRGACGSLIHTTHHPLEVLHVRSSSEMLRRVETYVFRICEWTLNASTRVQSGAEDLSSGAADPGSGILGIVVCIVKRTGSYTRSQIGWLLAVDAVLFGLAASQRRSDTLLGDVLARRGRCRGPNW